MSHFGREEDGGKLKGQNSLEFESSMVKFG